MVTLTSAEQALKTVYLDAVANQLNDGINPLLARFERTTRDVRGKEVRVLAPVGINGGFGAGTEDGDLPDAHSNRYVQFVSTLKNLYGRIELSDKAIRASVNASGAFVDLLNAEMEGLLKASAFNLGRMLYGDGSGTLCKVTQAGASGAVTADSVRNCIEGMAVDLVDAESGDVKASGRIEAIDRAAKTLTLSDKTAASSEGQLVVVQGSYRNELTGLGAIFASEGTLYGLDRAAHPWLKPYVKAIDGEIAETQLQAAIDRLDEVNGSRVDFIVCSAGVRRAYQELVVTYKRNIDITELAGGCKALTYNGIPLVSDRFVGEGELYLLNSADFRIHQLCDWKWLENEAGNVLHQVPGKPTYTATLVKYAELICDRPCGQAKLTGITEA